MYTVGDYLLDRLSELGMKEIFGVPGDYNLKFLDHITAHPHLKWIGNANELNAAYMADGYARTQGISAFVTTFGVGELSAANGIAGSYAEQVPVIEIVGSPKLSVQKAGKLMHHTLGDGDFKHFERLHQEITADIASLTFDNPTAEIDRILQVVVQTKRPVYINLPIDVAEAETTRPIYPLQTPKKTTTVQEKALVKQIETAFQQAKSPLVLVGNEILSHHLEKELNTFIQQYNLPIATLSMGKGAMNEEDSHFIGTYAGSLTAEPLKTRVDQADFLLLVGVKLTDSITSAFTHGFSEQQVISVGTDEVRIFGNKQEGLYLPTVLSELSTIEYDGYTGTFLPVKRVDSFIPSSAALTQKRYWQAMETFFEPEDIFVAEQGTSFFGGFSVPLKARMKFMGQPLWGSIGFTFPATIGSQIARPQSRHILSIGDGSLQLTIQEMGLLLREKIAPIIFVINNDGYTVERQIHGAKESYNDIPMWNYEKLPLVFGGNEDTVVTHKVLTEKELLATMTEARKDTHRLHWIEVVMSAQDSPELLVKMGNLFAKQNT